MKNIITVLLLLVACSSHAELVKSKNWNAAKDPSFCVGYSIVKIEQHPNEIYYKWMKEWYDNQISNDDLMMEPVDVDSVHSGYSMDNDDKIIECITVFDKVLEDEVDIR